MEKITKKEISEMCDELKSALEENIDLDVQLMNLVQLQKKSHYRLSKAREILHFIKII